MKRPLRLVAALLVTCVTLGCDASIPLLPQWTSNYAIPLDQIKAGLSAYQSGPDTTVTVPPGTSQPINSPPTVREIAGTLKDVLEKIESLGITNVRLQIEIRKAASAQIAFADTLLIGTDTASLSISPHRYGFVMAAADTMIADTVSLTAATVNLLAALGQNGGNLATMIRGRATTGAASVALLPHAVVTVKGYLILEMPVGGKP